MKIKAEIIRSLCRDGAPLKAIYFARLLGLSSQAWNRRRYFTCAEVKQIIHKLQEIQDELAANIKEQEQQS